MLLEVKRAIEGIIDLFSLNIKSFNEKRTYFQLANQKIELQNLNIELLLGYISVLGESVVLNLRSLSSIKINIDLNDEDLKSWIDENSKNEIYLSMTIKKELLLKEIINKDLDCSHICIYISVEKFISDLELKNIEKEVFSHTHSQIVILPLVDISIINNDFLCLVGYEFSKKIFVEELIDQSKVRKYAKEKIELLNLYCNTDRFPKKITPRHLYYTNQKITKQNELILHQINNQFIKLVLYFICNWSNAEAFLIKGHKEIKIYNNTIEQKKFSIETLEKIYKIYDSIYVMQTQDKILIARNIFTIYLNEENNIYDLMNQISKIQLAYESSTESYIKDKVKNFFDKKKELEKYARDTSESISKQISGITDNIMKSWLAFIAALLGASVTYFAKADLLLIAIFFLLYALLNMLILHYQIQLAQKELVLTRKSFEHFLGNIDVINNKRKQEVIGDTVRKKQILLALVIGWFKRSMVISTCICITLFLIIGFIGIKQHIQIKQTNLQIENKTVNDSTYK